MWSCAAAAVDYRLLAGPGLAVSCIQKRLSGCQRGKGGVSGEPGGTFELEKGREGGTGRTSSCQPKLEMRE